MHILYDHQMFAIQKIGGISRVFIELMRELSRSYDCFIHWYRGIKTDDYDISEYRHLLKRYWSIPNWCLLLPNANQEYINRSLFQYFILTSNRQYDIYHPSYYDAAFLDIAKPKKLAVTICDMIPEKILIGNPQFAHKFKNVIASKKILAQRSDIIFAISESTKKDIIEILEIKPEKIKVTYLASRIQDFSLTDLPEPCRVKPYFLYVGTRSKYKNFEIVMQAFAVESRLSTNFNLVCFGGTSDFLKPEIEFMEKNRIRENFIYIRGDDSLLKTLYSHAQALVYPSRYEGFGLPPLEAMECQCPVICCLTSSLPEVVGDAANYINSDSVEDLVRAMQKVVEDSEYRASAIAKGKQQASLFAWEKSARATWDGYRSVM
jgi:glycosyltransferase involved in cell wall biosynthesis